MNKSLKTCPKTKSDAKKWLKALRRSKYSYHIDDDPRDIPNFSKVEADHLRKCVKQCFKLLGNEGAWDAY